MKPTIVCLCGRGPFVREFLNANVAESLTGKLVLTVALIGYGECKATDEQKKILDELHLRKIDMADELLILNVGGYVGPSTAREIIYANQTGKPIRYLEPFDTEPRAG